MNKIEIGKSKSLDDIKKESPSISTHPLEYKR